MKRREIVVVLACLSFLLNACLSNKPFYSKENKNWTEDRPNPYLKLDHSVFLIGDAGLPTLKTQEPVLALLERQIKAAGEKSTVLYLGDNIYPNGLPEKDSPDRIKAERRLLEQVNILDGYEGNAYFIIGNHDWNKSHPDGKEYVIRQEEFLEEYLDRKKVMIPEDGCGDPEVIELTDDLTLIAINSEWFLQDWSENPDINKGCKIKSRSEFRSKLSELVDEYDDGNIIIALHHPVFSNGTHGGFFPFKSHLFPFGDRGVDTDLNDEYKKGIPIPMPVIGSLYPTLRYLGISPQDIPHTMNKELVDILIEVTHKKKDVIFASGHEHALEHFQFKDKDFIVSGSGSKSGFLKKGQGEQFGYMKEGFSRINYYVDGSVWMEMWAPRADSVTGKMIYRKKLRDQTLSTYEIPDDVVTNFPDSIEAVANPSFEAGKFKRSMFGDLYRDAWTTPVKWPVMDLSKVKGGLVPIKKGGGQQTTSLRLRAGDGKEYVLRSVAKDAAAILPDFAKNSVATYLINDFISIAHPFAASVIPQLAEAAEVYHTNPEFYYVPKQIHLGDFSELVGDQIFLFEERASKNREDDDFFGNSEKIRSTPRLLREIFDDHDHQVDYEWTVRSRLFDIYIGDWDRHDDQWRWATVEKDGITYYRPIPRDRDQAFIKIDGAIPWIASRNWGAFMFQNFDDDIHYINGYHFSPRWFDRFFLTHSDLDTWLKAANKIQAGMTDEVIESSIKNWPKPIFDLNGQEIIDKLKSRRDKLPEFATKFYKLMAEQVDVVATDKRDMIEVTRMEPNKLKITITGMNKKGELSEEIFNRTFLGEETKEVRIYGLDGDDKIKLTGTAESGPLLRVIAGEGDDEYTDESSVGGGKRNIVYDTPQGIKLEKGKETQDKTSTDYHVNDYDRKAFTFNNTFPLILPGWNIDDGFKIGAGFLSTKHGFRKSPYKSKTTFNASVALQTGAIDAHYTGDFIGVFGKNDFFLKADFFAPTYVRNYFGLGNDTQYKNTSRDSLNFNRLRMSQVIVSPRFKRAFNEHRHVFKFGPQFTFYNLEIDDHSENRFINVAPDSISGIMNLSSDAEPKNYGGLEIEYNLNGKDNPANPLRGLFWNVKAGYHWDLENFDVNYGQFESDFGFYYTMNLFQKTTFGTRVGGSVTTGDYLFYQASTLGRRNNLRGFRAERFSGDAAFFHNTDLRFNLFNWNNSFLPMDIGLIGYVDYGRVWLEGENSDTWHTGYGGGLFISPLSQAILSLTYNVAGDANEDFQVIEFKVGYFF